MNGGIKMDNSIDFLFIGGIIPKEIEDEILGKSKKGIQLAANNFQWSLIHGFDSNLVKPVTILNTMFVGSYPKSYEDPIVSGSEFSHTQNAKDINLGFINISIIKQFIRPFGEKRHLRKWATNGKDKKKVAFIYSLEPRFVRIAKLLKKYNPNIYICITVNDLPEYIMLGNKGNRLAVRAWKALSKLRIANGHKYLDGYMVVTEQIAQNLDIMDKPYIVVEGLIDTSEDKQEIKSKNEEKIKSIVYTGGLTEKYGLLNLINAFMQIESNEYRLIICGDGDTKEKIIEASKIDKRIEYLGVLSKEKIKECQQSATVLVNPRQNNSEFTKYSFPIKTIEYLLSGVPVISYRLSGIPQEYDDYLIYVEDDSIETLKNKIVQVCAMSQEERLNIGINNRRFVLEQKNHRIQTRRILEMILQNNDIE